MGVNELGRGGGTVLFTPIRKFAPQRWPIWAFCAWWRSSWALPHSRIPTRSLFAGAGGEMQVGNVVVEEMQLNEVEHPPGEGQEWGPHRRRCAGVCGPCVPVCVCIRVVSLCMHFGFVICVLSQ